MDEAVTIWLEYADADLNTAEFLFEKQWPRQFEIICYHCQQAGEKAVKALYLAAEVPGGIPRKHDLWFLLEQIKGQVGIPDNVWDAAEELDPYAIIVRYPSENRVDEALTKKALGHAKLIVDWAKKEIEKRVQNNGLLHN